MVEIMEAAAGDTGLLEQRSVEPVQHHSTACTTSFHFETYRTPAAVKAIETANRKLARAGVAERFTYSTTETVEPKLVTLDSGAQRTVYRSMTTLTLNRALISVAGWQFVATLVHEDDAVIIRTVPGRSLDGAVVRTDRLCDHCHTQRSRKDTYVIRRGADGQLKQVGSNCIAAFLGVRPAGLWALQFDLEPTISGAENLAAAAGDLRVPVRDILAHALAVSDHGRSFTTRSAVQFGGRATADDVMSVLFDQKGTGSEAAWRAEMQQLAAAIVEEQAELDAVLATGRALAGESDYARNVRALVDLEFCDLRHVALIASLVKIHYNELTRRAQKASWAPGFLAPAEDKIVGVVATVTTVKVVEGHYGPKTLIIFQTVDGHAIKWFATGSRDVNLGETYTVAGRVKAHEVFDDVDQTVITRAKLTPTPAQ